MSDLETKIYYTRVEHNLFPQECYTLAEQFPVGWNMPDFTYWFEHIGNVIASDFYCNHDGKDFRWPIKFAVFTENNPNSKPVFEFESHLTLHPSFYCEIEESK